MSVTRDRIRDGDVRGYALDPVAYRLLVVKLYHEERAADGLPDGPETWYTVHYES